MKKCSSNRELSQGNITAGKIILFAVAGIIILPVLGIGLVVGSFTISCNNKMSNINNQASEISKKLETMSIPTVRQTANANGDCLTGSGTSFAFNVTKSYASPLDAKNDTIKSLESAGIPAPKLSQEPKYKFAQDGSRSGGDTPIKQIELVYTVTDYDSLRFMFELDQPIPCSVTSEGKVLCAGEDKDALVDKIIASQPISSIFVKGSVRYE